MKIALVTPLPLEAHGVAYYSDHLLKAFQEVKEGWEFVVFSTDMTRPHHDSRLRIIPILSTQVDYSARLAREIASHAPDVVHIQHDFEIFGEDARFLDLLENLRTEGIPTVVTLHSIFERGFCPPCKLDTNIEKYQRAMGLLADRIIVHHAFPTRRFLLDAGIPRRKVKVIRHGTWNYQPSEPLSARKFLGLPEEGLIVAVVSSFGYLEEMSFLEAILYLRDFEQRVIFWIVGNSERYDFDPDEIEKKVITRAFSNNVIVSDLSVQIKWIKEIFSGPDIVLIPTKGERESTEVLHFALPARKPILISSESMAREEIGLFVQRELVYPPDRPELLARIILRIARDDEFRERILRKLSRYSSLTDWREIARLHLRLYRDLRKERISPTLIPS